MKSDFIPYTLKMKAAGLSDLQIESFRRNYVKATSGQNCYLQEKAIMPCGKLPHLADLPPTETDYDDQIAIIKLNGGLGTGMGLDGPKSLVPVRGNMTFLDVLLRQVSAHRSKNPQALPLMLLNSFNTSQPCREVVGKWSNLLAQPVPFELMQSRVPKVDELTGAPAEYPADSSYEWCPPGHGDVFLSLFCGGVLPTLINHNVRYLFISNIDNLGAVIDSRIPAWMEANKIPFVMEAARRCPSDSKGGHLARCIDGSLILRERSMCDPQELADFSDIEKYSYFNTNNLWVDVAALYKQLLNCGGILPLPLIVNRKHLLPCDSSTPKVLQLETAMGSAVNAFPNAVALEVPRRRFAPVKSFADLLAVSSNLYSVNSDFSLTLDESLEQPPLIVLPPLKSLEEFSAMFPHGAPDLRECTEFVVEGPVVVGSGVKCSGKVKIKADQPAYVADGSHLSGEINL